MNCATCVGVLTYPNSPDYRPDIDNLSPVQVRWNVDCACGPPAERADFRPMS
jgi:hypothetical protein